MRPARLPPRLPKKLLFREKEGEFRFLKKQQFIVQKKDGPVVVARGATRRRTRESVCALFRGLGREMRSSRKHAVMGGQG